MAFDQLHGVSTRAASVTEIIQWRLRIRCGRDRLSVRFRPVLPVARRCGVKRSPAGPPCTVPKLEAKPTTCRFTLQQARNDFQMSSSCEGAARVPGGAVGPRACCEPGAPPCALLLLEQKFETS